MTSSVAADSVIIGLVGIAAILRACTKGCHAKLVLPFPLSGRRILDAWDLVESEGWQRVDPGSTLEVAGDKQIHHLVQPGTTTTIQQCEAELN